MNNQDQQKFNSLKQKLSGRGALVVVIVLFATIGTLLLFRSGAETTNGELYISPATSSLSIGENVEVEIRLNPGTTVDGVEAELTYDPAVLEFVSVNGSGSPFELALGQQTGGNGKVSVARGTLQGGVSADALVAKVVFTALANSTDSQIQITGNAAAQGAYTNPVTTGATVTVAQAQTGGTMSLSPALPSVNQGENFTLEIRLDPGSPVQGAEAQLTYDQAKLEFVRIDASASVFDLALGAQTGGNGKVSISRGTLSGTVSTEGLLASVEFKALAGSGVSTVELAGNAAYDGNYTNPTTSNATVTFASTTATEPTAVITKPKDGVVVTSNLDVSVNANDDEGVTKVELYVDGELYDTATQSPYDFTVDASSLDNGSHNLQAKAYDNSGNVGNSQIVSFKVNNWSEDINNDGVVNLLDFSRLSFKFGQSGTDLGREDINFDGLIDMLDFNLLLSKFRQRLF